MADARTSSKPVLLFYCQHSLGIGHLTRSFALVTSLSRRFRVVFLNGGRLPAGVPVPADMERIDLPPLGMDDGHTVVSRDAGFDVAAAQAERRRLIDATVAAARPAVLLVELFPFGRKKFAGEILPMLRRARAGGALVACSLRDILVDARPDQRRHDDRARWLADRYFDLVLVHADAAFARLDDSFRPTKPMRTRVLHTGYVVPERAQAAGRVHGEHLLVSAGGGIVGEPLFRAVLAARQRLAAPPPLRIVAGPFLPEAAWQALRYDTAGERGVTLLRQVPDMVDEMRVARASISQCGYNTALDLIVAGVPALVAPYETATENEQRGRAERLAALGAMLCLPRGALDAAGLAAAIDRLRGFTPRPAALDLDGADASTRALEDALAQRRRGHQEAPCETA
jgi:predicted glycosyltransferase